MARTDHRNLDEGLPVEVTDAYPLAYLGREVQTRLQYRYTPERTHEVYLEPRFEIGLPYNGQLSLRVPTVLRNADRDTRFDLGRVGIDYLYNFNQETLTVPAFSLVGGVEAQDSREGGGFAPLLRVIVTKMIPGSRFWHRIHLNGVVQANVARSADERALRNVMIVGYEFRISPTIVGILDFVRDVPLHERPASNFGEFGVRIQVTPLMGLSFGAGGGASDEGDPIARGTGAFQWFAF